MNRFTLVLLTSSADYVDAFAKWSLRLTSRTQKHTRGGLLSLAHLASPSVAHEQPSVLSYERRSTRLAGDQQVHYKALIY